MEGENPFHPMGCLGAHRPGGPLPPEDTKVQDALGSVVGGLDAVLCQKNLVQPGRNNTSFSATVVDRMLSWFHTTCGGWNHGVEAGAGQGSHLARDTLLPQLLAARA
jgi:hypothetical protein